MLSDLLFYQSEHKCNYKGKKKDFSEQAVQFGIYLVDNLAEMILVIREVVMVGFDNQYLSEVI
jgi:hypothetical protein